jgi:hypothetical protein
MAALTGTSGLTPLINQQLQQVKMSLQKTQSAMEQGRQQAGAIARTVISKSVTASGAGTTLDIRV